MIIECHVKHILHVMRNMRYNSKNIWCWGSVPILLWNMSTASKTNKNKYLFVIHGICLILKGKNGDRKSYSLHKEPIEYWVHQFPPPPPPPPPPPIEFNVWPSLPSCLNSNVFVTVFRTNVERSGCREHKLHHTGKVSTTSTSTVLLEAYSLFGPCVSDLFLLLQISVTSTSTFTQLLSPECRSSFVRSVFA